MGNTGVCHFDKGHVTHSYVKNVHFSSDGEYTGGTAVPRMSFGVAPSGEMSISGRAAIFITLFYFTGRLPDVIAIRSLSCSVGR